MIWAIADLHFDPIGDKPMDIFGEKWINHEEKIKENWKKLVKEEDLVLLPGDISWGLKLKDSISDLEIINNLPGKKIISKGNHDYWWSSLGKMDELGFKSINFLHNNSYIYNGVEIFGTRAWLSKDYSDFKSQDEKIFYREIVRLKNSLNSSKLKNSKKIAMLHYPPFNQDLTPNEFAKVLNEYKVDLCIYGHLHAEGHKFIVEGEIDGVEYICVASDYLDFNLKEINI